MRNIFQSGGSNRSQNGNGSGKTDSTLDASTGVAAHGDDAVWNPPAVVPPIQRPGIGVPSRAPTAQATKPTGNTLTVGRDIHLKGEVKDCDALVVEGNIESATKIRLLRIAETGVFVGEAEIETAEISGRFEGKLKATARLLIRSTGKVSGNIQFSEICIEAGGQISGDVQITPKT